MSNHIRNRVVAPFDVDDCLIMHDVPTGPQPIKDIVWVSDPLTGSSMRFRINHNMVRLLQEEKAQGSFIIVWSRGGDEWANAVVTAMNLTGVVDLILTKPFAYFDDKDVKEWMPNRVYIEPDKRYKR